MNDTELNQWGTAFMPTLDREMDADDMLDDDVPTIMEWLGKKHPDLSDEQMEWVEIWLIEMDN